MYYKLSNIADESALKEEFGKTLQYNDIHKPVRMINGLNEETILVITNAYKGQISPAIWGMLPKAYNDDWYIFQNISNTLNISASELTEAAWKSEALDAARCLILVTGFFTAYLHQGTIYPYYVHRKDRRPFTLAGIYTKLEDGFLTCSLITNSSDAFVKKIHNISSQMPVVLSKESRNIWLDENIGSQKIERLLAESCTENLKAHLIAKEFFNQNITYESMLEPVSYTDLEQFVKA